ncbi:MAG: DUF1573 domain-containing protein [Planctomycetes bacterium]|nr:DUF1573 domain-containing protein [Planctomycetota bacterium]
MTLRSLALGLLAPALFLTISPEPAAASSPAAAVQDAPPKPRTVPKGRQTPVEVGKRPAPGPKVKPLEKPAQKGDQKPADATGDESRGARRAKPLDPTDPNFEKLKEKYRNAGLDEQGYPLGTDKTEQKLREIPGKQGVPDVPTDPNAKLAIEFGTDKHDFGRARQGDILEHIFEMEAGGSAPLIIRQANPTCGCTVSEVLVEGPAGSMVPYVFGEPIEPGRKITIAGRMNTANKKNQTQVRINVYHNDPVGTTGLALMANIEPYMTATPTFVQLGDIPQGSTRTQVVDVRTTRGELVALVLDERPGVKLPQGMDVQLAAVNADAEGRSAHWQVTVEIGPGAVEGNLGYQIALKSDTARPDAHEIEAKNAERAENAVKGGVDEHGHPVGTHEVSSDYKINVAVSGRVLGVMSYTPQFVSMGLVRPGQVVPRTVKVISHDPEFTLDPAKMSVELAADAGVPLKWAEHFVTEIKPAQGVNGVDVELRLSGLPEGADGSFRGKMIIRTGHPAKPTMEVRFSGVCRAGVGGGR